MPKKKRRTYDQDFKREAVRLVIEEQMRVSRVARDLGINENLLSKWKRKYESQGLDAFPGKGRLSSQEAEIARLRAENRRLTMERDILKKAVGIFSEAKR